MSESIIEVLRRRNRDDKEIYQHFHFRSMIWDSIQCHIRNDKVCCLIEKPCNIDGSEMRLPPCTSPRLTSVEIPYTQYNNSGEPYELDYFIINFCVSFANNDDDTDRDYSFTIKVPIDLEMHYSDKKFKEWLQEKKKELISKKEARDLPLLTKLMKAYPAKAKELLKEME